LGFESSIITDATKAIDQNELLIKLEHFSLKGGKEITSNQIFAK
jgi:hypothetical protein